MGIAYFFENFPTEDHGTQEIIDVENDFRAIVEDEYLLCISWIKRLQTINTSLPQKKTTGDSLVHWERMIPFYMKKYWIGRMESIENYLSDERALELNPLEERTWL